MMDSEDDAKDTLLDLRLKKRMFRGQSVKGRLKSETVVRSFYPVQAAPSMSPAIYPGTKKMKIFFCTYVYIHFLTFVHTYTMHIDKYMHTALDVYRSFYTSKFTRR
jgi:hypothetical protein